METKNTGYVKRNFIFYFQISGDFCIMHRFGSISRSVFIDNSWVFFKDILMLAFNGQAKTDLTV